MNRHLAEARAARHGSRRERLFAVREYANERWRIAREDSKAEEWWRSIVHRIEDAFALEIDKLYGTRDGAKDFFARNLYGVAGELHGDVRDVVTCLSSRWCTASWLSDVANESLDEIRREIARVSVTHIVERKLLDERGTGAHFATTGRMAHAYRIIRRMTPHEVARAKADRALVWAASAYEKTNG